MPELVSPFHFFYKISMLNVVINLLYQEAIMKLIAFFDSVYDYWNTVITFDEPKVLNVDRKSQNIRG